MAVMKKIDKATLFNIFEVGDEEVYRENGVEDLLHNTYILLGMTIKGVENYFIMEQMYQNRYGETFSTVRDSIKLKYFTGLIRYLERIDLSQSDTLYELKDLFGEQSIEYALTEMVDFFEGVEMYENCALLMKFYKVFFPKNSWKLQD
jgi:hypothetical protein